MRHHAIIVTSWDEKLIQAAHAKACEAFEYIKAKNVSPISPQAVNFYQSFAVFPDGSKEGWADSNAGDGSRNMLVSWLQSQVDEEDNPLLDWVEVQYGDDEHDTRIVSDSDEHLRDDEGDFPPFGAVP